MMMEEEVQKEKKNEILDKEEEKKQELDKEREEAQEKEIRIRTLLMKNNIGTVIIWVLQIYPPTKCDVHF